VFHSEKCKGVLLIAEKRRLIFKGVSSSSNGFRARFGTRREPPSCVHGWGGRHRFCLMPFTVMPISPRSRSIS